MPYATEYRLEWSTMSAVDTTGERIPSQIVRVSIFDTLSEADETNVVDLTPSGDPLHILVVDNDEDKFKVVRGKQAVIQFASNSTQNINLFTDSPDKRWLVEIYTNPDTDNVAIFKGHLIMSGLEQPFLPPPQVITLRASDGLAGLKDIFLVEDNGDEPAGKYRIAELIALCLKRTGHNFNINVINNIRTGTGTLSITDNSVTFSSPENIISLSPDHVGYFYPGQQITITGTGSNNGTYTVLAAGTIAFFTLVYLAENLTDESLTNATFSDDATTGHLYDKCYLDVRSFFSNGEFEDCFTILEKILGESCAIFQYKGEWWIIRIDEYEAVSNPFYRFIFDTDGDVVSNDTPDLIKNVGSTEDRKLALAQAVVRMDSMHRHIKETYEFEPFDEIICNGEYTRGDPTADPDVTVAGYTAYELDDWDVSKDWGSNETTPDIKSSIQRTFGPLGDEEQRFIMLTYPSDYLQGSLNYIRSCAIPMSRLAKWRFNFDVSAMTNPAGDGTVPAIGMFLFYGASGTIYALYPVDGTAAWLNTDPPIDLSWRVTNAEYTLFRTGISWAMFTDVDKTEWQSCNIEGPPVPEEGELKIFLTGANKNSGGFDTFNIRYQNLSFEYREYIGGTYDKYSGQFHQVTRDPATGFSAKRENQVYISDTTNPQNKGAIFIFGSRFHTTTVFYSSAPFGLGNPPGPEYFHRYGYLQAYDVWNQYRNSSRIFPGVGYGLGVDWVDLVHKIAITDADFNTNNRYFILISLNQNWKTGLWEATFIEVFRSDVPKSYADDHLFKYILANGRQ